MGSGPVIRSGLNTSILMQLFATYNFYLSALLFNNNYMLFSLDLDSDFINCHFFKSTRHVLEELESYNHYNIVCNKKPIS